MIGEVCRKQKPRTKSQYCEKGKAGSSKPKCRTAPAHRDRPSDPNRQDRPCRHQIVVLNIRETDSDRVQDEPDDQQMPFATQSARLSFSTTRCPCRTNCTRK